MSLTSRQRGTHHSSSSCVFKLHIDDCYIIQRIFLSQWRLFFFSSPQVVKEISQASGTWILFCPQKSDVNSEFNSEQDSQLNWIYEGFPVMSAIKRIENTASVGETESREHGAGEGDGEKKGNVDDRGIEENSWTGGGEGVRRSLWCPHSVPAATSSFSSSSHQLSHSHFEEINTHTHTNTGEDELAAAAAAPLTKNWLWDVCVRVCVTCVFSVHWKK